MKIYKEYITGFGGLTIILGFFDGMHRGHRKLIKSAVEWGKLNNSKTAILTFNTSPAEYFNEKYSYIYSREDNYEIAAVLGVDYIFSVDFSSVANLSADEYLKNVADIFSPAAIFSGFNYSFGHNKCGNIDMLAKYAEQFGYEYHCIDAEKVANEIVSSSRIKRYLTEGDITNANLMLGENFFIKSNVIEGQKFGRTIGFPTANMRYPEKIINLPHGVYKAEVAGMKAVMNWGTKPTFGGQAELLEIHIPGFNGSLYGEELKVTVMKKVREEMKFSGPDELRLQIAEDVKICSK